MGARVARACVITASDGVAAGTREDLSGQAVADRLDAAGFEVARREVVADDEARLADALRAAVDDGFELVVTTGGTGLGPRDVTPQATTPLLDYEVPGMSEAMRRAGAEKTPMAMLSRGVAGVRGRSLLLNLPGSVKGATESLDAVMPALPHALQLLKGDTEHR